MQFYAQAWDYTDLDNPIGETQTVAKGADAELPTTENGLPKHLGSEEEEEDLLYLAYWDGDYTNITENRNIVAVYAPLVTLITYDKTGSTPDDPEEIQIPCLSNPNLTPAAVSEEGYSAAWFRSYEGEWLPDTACEQPVLPNPELREYEYTYIWYKELVFTLKENDETSYSTNYKLFCSTFIGDDEEIHFRYTLCVPFSPEEPAMNFWDLADSDPEDVTIPIEAPNDDYYFIPLSYFKFTVKSGDSCSDPMELSLLIPMFENSGDEPVLIADAIADLEYESELPQTE